MRIKGHIVFARSAGPDYNRTNSKFKDRLLLSIAKVAVASAAIA
jgi:hypothetical protein